MGPISTFIKNKYTVPPLWHDSLGQLGHLLDAEVRHHHGHSLILPGVRLPQHGAEQGAEGSQHLLYIIFNFNIALFADVGCLSANCLLAFC